MPIARRLAEAAGAAPPTTPTAHGGGGHGADLATLRRLAAGLGVETGDLLALTLLHEASHRILEREAAGARAHPVEVARRRLGEAPGRPDLEGTLRAFGPAFPPAAALPDPALAVEPPGGPRRTRAGRDLEELLLVRLSATNPALAGLRPLFDDADLVASSDYLRVLEALDRPSPGRARAGGAPGAEAPAPEPPAVMDLLRAPIEAAPDSLAGQLRWVRRHWSGALTPALRQRLGLALDVLAEETRARVLRDAPPGGPGPEVEIPVLAPTAEPGRFSVDAPWMPQVVLQAKNTFVWLAQLARDHGRVITTLDQVPDAELVRLAAAGVTGLWLIGLWARSRASREIKRRMGDREAAASAYAIDRYAIAADLGGDAALDDLRTRAAAHGIRLASDMVPNHMGLDSAWVLAHPERFIGLDEPPFPDYHFTGPDLSPDPAVAIQLEDGYWDRRGAAVVFRREEVATGRVRYLYHGNDGTATPWNDTAQLDYLQAEVREAVIALILDVARRFPIIRFDAAMTLARRHIERLWYPPPGHGGAIPSRAEYGRLSTAAFRRRMPREFWRDVVEAVARDAPGTLLLAEAFWLMEGYFVRSLGMHRVYNSAFMHLLRDERNADYRALLRETVASDPRVLERYVNFMSNPDERSAADQFGTGERYAAVATLLATLPGLPLLGHGQLEGYRERYGMEFRRARLDERPDPAVAALHEARLLPLLRRRGQFATAATFRLFDVVAEDGTVVEDVFAYTNRAAGERSLVMVHDRDTTVRGRLHRSVPFTAVDDDRGARTETIAAALDLEAGAWYAARDLVDGREHLVRASSLEAQGLGLALGPYGCRVLLDWHRLPDGPPEAEAALAQLDTSPGRGIIAAP